MQHWHWATACWDKLLIMAQPGGQVGCVTIMMENKSDQPPGQQQGIIMIIGDNY